MPRPARSTLFPYTTLFRSVVGGGAALVAFGGEDGQPAGAEPVADPAERVDAGHGVSCWSGAARHGGHPCRPRDRGVLDRKSTRLNSSHMSISYAVFCLKKK